MRALVWSVSALLLASVGAGCVGDEAQHEPVVDGILAEFDIDPELPFTLDAGLDGCVQMVVVPPVEMSTGQAELPDGFVARDLSEYLGLPAPSGRAFVVMTSVTCEHGVIADGALESGQVGIFIEKPTVANVSVGGGLDFYIVEYYSSSERELSVLDAVGGRSVPTTAEATVEGAVGAVPSGWGAVTDAATGDDIQTFSLQGAQPRPFSETVRFWHASESGTSFFEYVVEDASTWRGTVTDCSFAEGSAAARITGSTSCASEETIASIFESFGGAGTFRSLPGVFPAA